MVGRKSRVSRDKLSKEAVDGAGFQPLSINTLDFKAKCYLR